MCRAGYQSEPLWGQFTACLHLTLTFLQSGPWHGEVQGCLPAQIRASCLIVFILFLEMMLNKNQTEPLSPTFL